MEILDWLSLAGGAGVTVLVILALGYWIVQEAQAHRPRPESPPATPPAEANCPPDRPDADAQPRP